MYTSYRAPFSLDHSLFVPKILSFLNYSVVEDWAASQSLLFISEGGQSPLLFMRNDRSLRALCIQTFE